MAFEGIASVVGSDEPEARVGQRTALMIIDMQYFDAHPEHGLGAKATAGGLGADVEAYFTRVETVVVPAIHNLQVACRAAGLPVIHVRITSLLASGSDASPAHKRLGINVLPGSKEAEFLEQVAPLPEELVFNKTTTGVFVSTNADYVLRNLGIDTLIVAGVVTNGCVESSVRHAADLGYQVLLVEDGCAAWTVEGHEHALRHLDRTYAFVKSHADLLEQIAALPSPGST